MANEIKRKLAMKEFYDLLEDHGYKPLERYVTCRVKINIRCPEGHVWNVEPGQFKAGHRCPDCNWRGATVAGKKFAENIKALGGQVKGTYVNSSTSVECICSKGHACFPNPGSIVAGNGMCKTCGNGVDEAKEYFHELAREAGVTVVGQYVNRATHVDCICKNGHPCKIQPGAFKRGVGYCKKCAGNDTESARERFLEWMKQNGFKVLEDYKDGLTPVRAECPKGHICKVKPSYIREGKGTGCTECTSKSRGEDKVKESLTKLGVSFIRESKMGEQGVVPRYDFDLTEEKIIIETDGQQHFKFGGRWMPTREVFKKKRMVDVLKQVKAQNKDYTVVRIDYKWYGKPVEDFVKFIKDIIDIPYEDRPWAVYSNPDMYKWIDEIRASCSQQPSQ